MSLVVAVVLAVAFLDPPWNVLVIFLAVVWEGFEIWLYLRWRNKRSLMGAEALIGERGITVGTCDPEGQARVKGRFWQVTSSQTVGPDVEIEVERIEGLRLFVRPLGAVTESLPSTSSKQAR